MQFKVPQFIDVEDKIFGPLTWKQFVFLAGGAGLCFICYKLLPIYIAVPFILIIGPLAGMLAFYKINNKPFIFTMEAAIKYFLQTKLYLWKREERKQVVKKEENVNSFNPEMLSKMSGNKLKEISWSLDVLDMKK
jgi:hypothetical protein